LTRRTASRHGAQVRRRPTGERMEAMGASGGKGTKMPKMMQGTFGRLATNGILEAKEADARLAGFKVERCKETGTACASRGEGADLEYAYKAMRKGAGCWLIMYNSKFYDKPIGRMGI